MTSPSSTTTTIPTSESQQKFLAQAAQSQMLGKDSSSASSTLSTNTAMISQFIAQLAETRNSALRASFAAAAAAAAATVAASTSSSSTRTISPMPTTTTKQPSDATVSRSSASSPDTGTMIDGGSLGDNGDDVLDGSSPESTLHSPPCSRSSSRSGPVSSGRPQRKLKIYCVDEKLDIIDYAKVIGNRAAGREYNVAESSIREWRKNEQKLRTQAENSRLSQPNNPDKEAFHQRLYTELVAYINEHREDITWIKVRDKAQEFWKDHGDKYLDGLTTMHLQGWVARFILKARQAEEIPEIAPPVSMPNTGVTNSSSSATTVFSTASSSTAATTSTSSTSSASSNLLNGAISMVPSTSFQSFTKDPPTKRSRLSSSDTSTDFHTSGSLTSSPESGIKSRRKNGAPKRVLGATVKTSTNSPTPLDLSKNQTDVNANTTSKSDRSSGNDSTPLEVC